MLIAVQTSGGSKAPNPKNAFQVNSVLIKLTALAKFSGACHQKNSQRNQ
jgi:hypothetical protein